MSRTLRVGVALAVTAGLAAWFFHQYHDAVTTAPWQQWNLRDFAGPALLIVASHLLRAARLHAEMRALSFAACWRLLAYHTFWVNILPMRSGEMALPLLLARHHQVPLVRATATLLWLRVQDLMVLILLAAILWPELPWFARLGIVALLVVALLLLPFWLALAERLHWPWLERFIAALRIAITHSHPVWHWTIANWCVKIAAVGWLLAALLPLDGFAALGGALAGELAAIQPVQGIAGFGPYEAAVAALCQTFYAIPLASGVVAGFAAHLLLLAVSTLMAFLAWIGNQ